MKYKSIKYAIITSLPPVSHLRPFTSSRQTHNMYDVGSMGIPWYPGMFQKPKWTLTDMEFWESNEVWHKDEFELLATLQNPNYFRMHLHERYAAIETGDTIS